MQLVDGESNKINFNNVDCNETSLSHSRSNYAALPCSYAIRLLPVGEVCGDGGVCGYGVSVFGEEAREADGGVRGIGPAVPAFREDCIGADTMECSGCGSSHSACRFVVKRKGKKVKTNLHKPCEGGEVVRFRKMFVFLQQKGKT